MGGAMDGVLALGRIEMEKQGEGSCSDPEGECRDSPILAKPVVEESGANPPRIPPEFHPHSPLNSTRIPPLNSTRIPPEIHPRIPPPNPTPEFHP
eukprot:265820-Prorocentrum_minimum.AAC.1